MLRRLGLAGLLAVAACSGSGARTAAVPPARVSVSPLVAASPSVSPGPRFPATKEGALAIGRAFFTAASDANLSGDTHVLRSLATPACNCLAAAEAIEATYAKGDRYVDMPFTIRSVSNAIVKGAAGAVTVTYDIAAGDLITAGGKTKRYDSVVGQVSVLTLAASDGAWLVGRSTTLVAGK